MTTGYQHLTGDLRCQLYALKSKGANQHEIALFLGVSPSTISRVSRVNYLCRSRQLPLPVYEKKYS